MSQDDIDLSTQRKRPRLTIDVPKACASSNNDTDSGATIEISLTSRIPKFSTIRRGEKSYEESFLRKKADIPSEIIPGLYLGNAKTAAAYLRGELDDDHQYPVISRIVTILSDRPYPLPLPSPKGSGTKIERLRLNKLDTVDEELLSDLDRTGQFIHEGVQKYMLATKPLHKNIHVQAMSSIITQMQCMNIHDDIPRLQSHKSIPTLQARPSLRETILQRPHRRAFSSPTNGYMNENSVVTSPIPRPGAVLVHCHKGVSRSATIVAAYLLKYHLDLVRTVDVTSPEVSGWDQDPTAQAIKFIRAKRAIVNPNIGFRAQLLQYFQLDCSLKDEDGQYKDEYLTYQEDYADIARTAKLFVRRRKEAARNARAEKLEAEPIESD